MSGKKSIYPKRLRTTLANMKGRCYYPKTNGYKYYGGKGVIICEEWLNDKEAFYEWGINNGYADNLTIDRIDVNGNYEPSNCRWATLKVQANNRTNNVFLEYNGEIKTAYQWSQETGISTGALKNRFEKGKDMLDDYSSLSVEIEGKIKTLQELSDESGVPYSRVARRYHDGWNPLDLTVDSKLNETQYIEINGEVHTVLEWGEISGLTKGLILMRINRGWKGKELLQPVQLTGRHKRYIEVNGTSHTIDEWSNIIGISRGSFNVRLKKGLDGDELIAPNSFV